MFLSLVTLVATKTTFPVTSIMLTATGVVVLIEMIPVDGLGNNLTSLVSKLLTASREVVNALGNAKVAPKLPTAAL